jgi:hypothetical protein
MPKEPKSRTIPGESVMIMQQTDQARGNGAPPSAKAQEKLSRYRLAEPCAGVGMTYGKPDEPESRRNPGEFWT